MTSMVRDKDDVDALVCVQPRGRTPRTPPYFQELQVFLWYGCTIRLALRILVLVGAQVGLPWHYRKSSFTSCIIENGIDS